MADSNFREFINQVKPIRLREPLAEMLGAFISDDNVIEEPIDEREPLAPEEILFTEDFSQSLGSSWTQTITPTIISEELSARDFYIHTAETFPSQNGLELSFEIKSSSSRPSGGFEIKLVEKDYDSNYATLRLDTQSNTIYYLEGHCVEPTPRVQVSSHFPTDNEFHQFTLRMHTDGSAEWLLDGEVQFQRNNFDLGGDYTLVVTGSSLIGSSENNVFLDNIQLSSLNEAAPQEDICPEVAHTPAQNSCGVGRCLSNGICCYDYAQYYCEGYCYYSRERAMSQSQGRCSEWRIIC